MIKLIIIILFLIVTAKMLRTILPENVLSYIEDFIGPCPIQKVRKKELLDMIKPGRTGIPYWTIEYCPNAFKPCFHYCFIIPNCDYFENMKIMDDNTFLFNDFERGDGLPDVYVRYHCISIEYEWRKKLLKNNIFMPTGTAYFVSWEGADSILFNLTYNNANDYDILYILKYSRGKTPKEIYESIVKRFEIVERGRKNKNYQKRTLKKMAAILSI